MNRQDFAELQQKFNLSGMTLKSFLTQEGVTYSTYNYWSKKMKAESGPETLPVAPITIHKRDGGRAYDGDVRLNDVAMPGVTLAFPNGVRAHFGNGSEGVLMEVLSKSMCHVLP